MNILLEVPTWLGDSVMITPAVENIIKAYPQARITIFGTEIASSIFVHHPNIENIIIDKSRTAKNRYIWLYKTAKNLKFDVVFSFRRRFSSKFFAHFINTKNRYYYQRYDKTNKHQVLRYNDFVNTSLKVDCLAPALKIYQISHAKPKHKTLGINPGASYGSAKRWYPEKFAQVAAQLANKYEVVIFGGIQEKNIANDIEKILADKGIKNYQNLAGKTNINELIDKISQLDLFITGDSGPMHLAAAFQVPTVAIFGPTKDNETAQWMNEKSVIVKQNFTCQPCMKRVCPLKNEQHHQCMKNTDAQQVLAAVNNLFKG